MHCRRRANGKMRAIKCSWLSGDGLDRRVSNANLRAREDDEAQTRAILYDIGPETDGKL